MCAYSAYVTHRVRYTRDGAQFKRSTKFTCRLSHSMKIAFVFCQPNCIQYSGRNIVNHLIRFDVYMRSPEHCHCSTLFCFQHCRFSADNVLTTRARTRTQYSLNLLKIRNYMAYDSNILCNSSIIFLRIQ